MDRDALVARCESRYQDNSNAIFSAAEWADYLNDAYAEVVGSTPEWPFLEARATNLSISANANTASLPTDAWRVTAVWNATDKFPLRPLHGRSAYREWFPDPESSTGRPQYYRLRANVLEVFPYADATTTLHVDYYADPGSLSAGNVEPVFPERFHRILVDGALSYAHHDDGHTEQAVLHRQRFEQGIFRMMDDLLSNRLEEFPQIVDTTLY